jgi:SLT domain-containing protein
MTAGQLAPYAGSRQRRRVCSEHRLTWTAERHRRGRAIVRQQAKRRAKRRQNEQTHSLARQRGATTGPLTNGRTAAYQEDYTYLGRHEDAWFEQAYEMERTWWISPKHSVSSQ